MNVTPASSESPHRRHREGTTGGIVLGWFALLLFVVGCGRGDDAPDDPVIRLIDRLEDAQIESQLDLGRTDLPLELLRGVEVISREDALIWRDFDGSLGGRDALLPASVLRGMQGGTVPERADPLQPRFDGSAGERRLMLSPGQAFLSVAPARPDQTYQAELTATGRDLDQALIALVELARPLSARELTDPGAILAAFSAAGSRLHRLEPSRVIDGLRVRFAGTIHTNVGPTRALLLTVVAGTAELELDDIHVRQPDTFNEQLLRRKAEFSHPFVRRIEVNRDFRESVVVVPRAEVRLPLTLPDRPSRLSFSIGFPDGGLDQAVDVTVTAAEIGGGERIQADYPVDGKDRPGLWNDFSLDLARLKGRRVELAIAIRMVGGGGGRGVAIGNPVIETDRPAAELPPDVVIVSLDTMRADRMSLYGAEHPTTPFLEELAPSCLVFEAAIAPAAYTLPSHASILTGQLPDRIASLKPIKGLNPRKAPLLAREFRAAGYETIAFTGGGYVHPEFGFDPGFERFATIDLGMVLRTGGFDEVSRNALEDLTRILEAPRRRPRFLFIHTFAAHNYRAPAEDLLAVGADPAQIEELARTNLDHRPVLKLLEELGGINVENRERLTWLYDGAQRVADAFMRHLVGEMERTDRLDDSYLFVFSDHGEELFEHGGFGHAHQVYEELIRVPFLARGPGIVAGRSPDVVSITDLAPTLRELCDLPRTRAGMDGRSLVKLLQGGTLPANPVVARACPDRTTTLHAFRSSDLKLLYRHDPEWRALFSLSDDPGEGQDLSTEKADLARKLQESLGQRLDRIQEEGSGASDVDLSDSMQKELERLGYLNNPGNKGRQDGKGR